MDKRVLFDFEIEFMNGGTYRREIIKVIANV
jgi:hypothetical protein